MNTKTAINMLARQALSQVSGVDLTTCMRAYRDKYIRNHYWVVDNEGIKKSYQLTPDESRVIAAACNYNTTMFNYLIKLEGINVQDT